MNDTYMKKQASKNFEDAHKCIDEILKYVNHLESETLRLKKENECLKENAKRFADNQLIEENKRLSEELNLSFGMFDSEKEKKEYEKFCKKHQHLSKGRILKISESKYMPYVKFSSNGIGIEKVVVCPHCGKEQDITDISVW